MRVWENLQCLLQARYPQNSVHVEASHGSTLAADNHHTCQIFCSFDFSSMTNRCAIYCVALLRASSWYLGLKQKGRNLPWTPHRTRVLSSNCSPRSLLSFVSSTVLWVSMFPLSPPDSSPRLVHLCLALQMSLSPSKSTLQYFHSQSFPATAPHPASHIGKPQVPPLVSSSSPFCKSTSLPRPPCQICKQLQDDTKLVYHLESWRLPEVLLW